MTKRYCYIVMAKHNSLIEYLPQNLSVSGQGIITITGILKKGSGPIINGNNYKEAEISMKTHLSNALLMEVEE